MKQWMFCALVFGSCLAVSLALPSVAGAQLVLYDNFSESRIDPAKWTGTGNDISDLLETVRELSPSNGLPANKRLRFSLTSYAGTAGDSGGVGGLFGLDFTHPESLREIAFTVVVKRALAIGCATNASGNTGEAAELRGRFFNTELPPTSQIGDIELAIGVQRISTDTTNALTAVAFYQRCDDAGCGSRTTLDYKVLGPVIVRQPVKLRVKWDQPNHQFIFQMNDAPQVLSPYTVSDTSPAFAQLKGIDIAKGVPNCTSTPRPLASMEALFDDVFVNP